MMDAILTHINDLIGHHDDFGVETYKFEIEIRDPSFIVHRRGWLGLAISQDFRADLVAHFPDHLFESRKCGLRGNFTLTVSY